LFGADPDGSSPPIACGCIPDAVCPSQSVRASRFLQKYLKNVQTVRPARGQQSPRIELAEVGSNLTERPREQEHAALLSGELVFANVELRLDVLQEQLGLPLVFRRGFIQELKVSAPLSPSGAIRTRVSQHP